MFTSIVKRDVSLRWRGMIPSAYRKSGHCHGGKRVRSAKSVKTGQPVQEGEFNQLLHGPAEVSGKPSVNIYSQKATTQSKTWKRERKRGCRRTRKGIRGGSNRTWWGGPGARRAASACSSKMQETEAVPSVAIDTRWPLKTFLNARS